MDLSIIIPHYNDSANLSKLLGTIPRQIKVIIVDDNSLHCHQEVLAEIGSEFANVRLLANDKGIKGAGTCRNIGLTHCRSEWVVFSDSDDCFVDGAFHTIKANIVTAASDCDIIYFSPTSIDAQTGMQSDRHHYYARLVSDYIKSESEKIRYRFVTPWSKVFRHNMLLEHNILFDEVLASNDTMFSIKCGYSARQIAVSAATIYCVTRRGNSLTTTFSDEIMHSRLGVLFRQNDFLYRRGLRRFQVPVISIFRNFMQIMSFRQFNEILYNVLRLRWKFFKDRNS